MENLARYFNSFSESGIKILESSLAETQRRKQHFISPEHILFALMKEESELFNATMLKHLIDSNKVRLAVETRLENTPQHTGEGFRIAPQATDIFRHSMDKARAEGRRTIEPSDICHVLATWKFNSLEDILQNPDGSVSVFKNSG